MVHAGRAVAGSGVEPSATPVPRPLVAPRARALFDGLEPLVAGVEGCRLEAVRDPDGEWCGRPGVTPEAATLAVAGVLESTGALVDGAWTGAFDLSRGDGSGALMVVSGPERPRPARLLRLRVLALHHRVRSAVEAADALCERAGRLAADVGSVVVENEALRALRRSQRRLAAAVAAGSGTTGVARALVEATGRSVALWDGGVLVAAAAPGAATVGPVREPALPTPLVERRAFRSDGWLCCAVRAADSEVVVGVADPEGTFDGIAAALIEDATTAAAHEVALLRAGRPSRSWEDLARALAAGDEEASRAHASSLGYDLDRPHQAAVVSCHPPAPRLADAVRWAAGAQEAGVLATTAAPGAVVVTASSLDWEAFAAELRSHLRRPELAVGTSGWRDRAEGMGGAVREAEAALRLASSSGATGVVHFDDLGVLRILAADGDTTELRRYVQRWLGPLLAYDARRGTDLVGTLAVYLERGGSVAQAAQALIVHPSTLKYRLNRVRELTGVDLNDPDARFQLQLAARAHAAVAALTGAPCPPAHRPWEASGTDPVQSK